MTIHNGRGLGSNFVTRILEMGAFRKGSQTKGRPWAVLGNRMIGTLMVAYAFCGVCLNFRGRPKSTHSTV